MTKGALIIDLMVTLQVAALASTFWWLWRVLSTGKLTNSMLPIDRRKWPIVYCGFVAIFACVAFVLTWLLISFIPEVVRTGT